jgi:CubicO group peptidase (beta-lactamase class C family)
MTVIAYIDLAVKGKIAPADKLSKYLPDFPRADEITLDHLVRHRAGIPHRVTDDGEECAPRTAADMVALAARKPLEFTPGERHAYSSGGFSVLARVLEIASGESYGDLVKRVVFDPAGLARTSHADSREILEDRASPYALGADGKPVNSPLQDLSVLVGAGSVWSTPRDLFALLTRVRKGGFGEGPRLSSVDADGVDWNGATSGFRAFADWHAKTDVTVILTSNLATGAADRLRRDVPLLATADTAPAPAPLPEVRPIPVAAADLEKLEGRYELRPGTTLSVKSEGGTLRVNVRTLVPLGPRTFFSWEDYGTVEFVFEEGGGRPVRMDWKSEGATYPCPRTGDL